MENDEELKTQIADLKAKYEFVLDVLFALTERVQPPGIRYPVLALCYGFTAEHVEALNQFWKWASKQDEATLTKDDLFREYERRMPEPLQGKLEHLLRADLADKRRPFYTRLVFGEPSSLDGTDDDEDLSL